MFLLMVISLWFNAHLVPLAGSRSLTAKSRCVSGANSAIGDPATACLSDPSVPRASAWAMRRPRRVSRSAIGTVRECSPHRIESGV